MSQLITDMTNAVTWTVLQQLGNANGLAHVDLTLAEGRNSLTCFPTARWEYLCGELHIPEWRSIQVEVSHPEGLHDHEEGACEGRASWALQRSRTRRGYGNV
jgi:hypothetical protein